MRMGGRLKVTRAGRCRRHKLRPLLLAGAVALAPALAFASPRENPLPPLPVYKARATPPVITPPPDDGLENGGFYIEANELVDDETGHTVQAHGEVEARYNGRTLRANDVVYDTQTGIVTATGDVTIVNPDGTAEFSQSAVLDREMSAGVAMAFSTRLKETLRANGGLTSKPVEVSIAAASAVHRSPTLTELNQAIFTACPVCARHPNPTWSIKAGKVIEDKKRQVIIFRDAQILVRGVPIFYTPVLVNADPAVKRKSGLLIPEINVSSLRGLSYEQPYLQVISPSEDLIVSPQINTKVNPFLNVDWRKRFYSGAIDVRAGYTYEQDFNSQGEKLGNATSRSYILAKGLFAINDDWDWGFTAERTSDPLIFDRYGVADPFIERGLYSADDRRLISQAYTTYQIPDLYISVAAMDVQGLRSTDVQGTFPLVAPLIEARWEPDFAVLGGRLRVQASGVALTRDESPIDPTAPGIDSRRGTIEANWQSTYILPNGIRFDPFIDLRGDLYSLAELPAPFARNATISRGLPTAGVNVTWPFLRRVGDRFTVVLEPVAQVVLSPLVRQDPRIPIEDSVDFQFDETNLFQIQKAPGYDLLDSGPQFNLAGRATVITDDGYYASALIGRSFRTTPNPFVPLRTGLQGTSSDWIMAADASPYNGVNFFSRWRLDANSFAVNYVETGVDVTTPRFDGQIRYIQEAHDATGQPVKDLDFHGEVFILKNWGLSAYGAREFQTGVWRHADFGIVYRDDCIRVEILYNRNNTNNGVLGPSQGVGFRLSLATFGNSVYARSEAETEPPPP
ncbi:MAG TPA: LPS assembly protein LptD [Caulobacteraceae bacterium]